MSTQVSVPGHATDLSSGTNLQSGFGARSEELFGEFNKFYFASTQILDIYDEFKMSLFDQPNTSRVILISGPNGIGKTAIVEDWASKIPMQASNPIDYRPVLKMKPARDDKPHLWVRSLATEIEWPLLPKTESGKETEGLMLKMLEESGTRMLFMPRANNLSKNGSSISPNLRPLLIRLLDDGRLTIVFSGDEKFHDILRTIPEFIPAIQSNITIQPLRYSLDLAEEDGEKSEQSYCDWHALFEAMSNHLPVDTKVFDDPAMLDSMHHATHGRIPAVVRLTRSALHRMVSRFTYRPADPTVAEIDTGKLKLEKQDFHQAFKAFEPKAINPFTADWKKELEERRIAAFAGQFNGNLDQEEMMRQIR